MNFVSGAWMPAFPVTLTFVILLTSVLVWKLPRKLARIKFTGMFLALYGALMLGGSFAQASMMSGTGDALHELAIIVLGLLVIRLGGLTIFEVLLRPLGLNTPRIVEDLVTLAITICWGLVRLRYDGVNLSGIVTTSAVITGIIAFSMQETLGNILGGVALQLDNSIKIGDWIIVDNIGGRVIEVHWRHTAVRSRTGEVVIFPNSFLMKGKFTVVGGNRVPQCQRSVRFSMGMDVFPTQVIAVVERSLRMAIIPNVSRNPAPTVSLEYQNGRPQYIARYWLTNPAQDEITEAKINLHIMAALQREGIAQIKTAMDDSSRTDEVIRDRAAFLHSVELFSHLDDGELLELATALTYAVFISGDVMTCQGEIADWLYVIIKGEADVWFEANEEGSDRRHLATLQAGRVFGEMGLMTGEPRRATVTARTDAECYRIDKRNFRGIIQSRPEMAEKFAAILSERNKSLVAMQNEVDSTSTKVQQDRILDNIRRFFAL